MSRGREFPLEDEKKNVTGSEGLEEGHDGERGVEDRRRAKGVLRIERGKDTRLRRRFCAIALEKEKKQ